MTATSSMDGRLILGRISTFVLAAGAAITPMLNAIYNNSSFNSAKLFFVLLFLNLLHTIKYPRLFFCREFIFYAAFTAYMFLSLLWAPNALLGLNTLVPSINFLLILTLFGSLVRYHDLRTVLTGFLSGFLIGASAYTYIEGFPFVFPKGFSYNAGAAMYLFGLFVTLIFGWFTKSRVMALSIGFVIMLHIVATTSIKTNLGILAGVLVVTTVFFGRSVRMVFRNFVFFSAFAGLMAYGISTNTAVIERIQSGVDRVVLGVAALQARQDMTGRTSVELREHWTTLGLEGWVGNPVFGYGVEAFRADNGITSHSTPIDLLYNTGIIGFTLFYAIFASIAWRLWESRWTDANSLRPLLLAGLTCYVFMTLSGTMLYQTFLAIFIALSAALLVQLNGDGSHQDLSTGRTKR